MVTQPKSLMQLCLDNVVENRQLHWTRSSDGRSCTFRDADLHFPNRVSEGLLKTVSAKRFLDDRLMTLFAPRNVHLRDVRIPSATHLSIKGLKILKHHTLRSLEIHRCRLLCIQDILGCLGDQTLAQLQDLSISHNGMMGIARKNEEGTPGLPVKLPTVTPAAASKLIRLRNLALKDTELSNEDLQTITDNVPGLKTLDLSESASLTDISPLVKYKEQLTSLCLYDVPLYAQATDTLRQLRCLTHLDVSCSCRERRSKAYRQRDFFVTSLLQHPSDLPDLVSLDMSGREHPPENLLSEYLAAHPDLKFLGLWANHACCYKEIINNKAHYVVTGYATLPQLTMAHSYYRRRGDGPIILQYLWDFVAEMNEGNHPQEHH